MTVAVPPGGTSRRRRCSPAVWQVLVAPGDASKPGQPLLVLEAMKMETSYRAADRARRQRVVARVGEQVPAGSPLVVLSP